MKKAEIKKIKSLSQADLSYLKSLGFADHWLSYANEFGVFETANILINWNSAWERKNCFFYEIARNSLPIGSDKAGNLIYLTNITSSQSKVGLLASNGEIFFTVSNSLEEFIEIIDAVDLGLIEENIKRCLKLRLSFGAPKKFNINHSKVGEVFDLFPFGENTQGILSHKNGVYTAKCYNKSQDAEKAKKRDLVAWVLLLLFAIVFFTILTNLNVEFGVQVSIFLFLIFGMVAAFSFKDRLVGNWRRF